LCQFICIPNPSQYRLMTSNTCWRFFFFSSMKKQGNVINKEEISKN
jgi:hypothetical protein